MPELLNSDSSQRTFTTSVVLIIAAIFLFDVQGALIKHMGSRYPVEQIAFFRNLFAILPNLLVLYLSAEWLAGGRAWK